MILIDPGGEVFGQARAADLAGRARISCSSARATRASTSGSASFVDLELSIGDYVVTGGELPALVVIDAVMRLLPGAIDELSTAEESFSAGLARVPAVHAAAVVPRHRRAGDPRPRATTARSRTGGTSGPLERTRERRPDLLATE